MQLLRQRRTPLQFCIHDRPQSRTSEPPRVICKPTLSAYVGLAYPTGWPNPPTTTCNHHCGVGLELVWSEARPGPRSLQDHEVTRNPSDRLNACFVSSSHSAVPSQTYRCPYSSNSSRVGLLGAHGPLVVDLLRLVLPTGSPRMGHDRHRTCRRRLFRDPWFARGTSFVAVSWAEADSELYTGIVDIITHKPLSLM